MVWCGAYLDLTDFPGAADHMVHAHRVHRIHEHAACSCCGGGRGRDHPGCGSGHGCGHIHPSIHLLVIKQEEKNGMEGMHQNVGSTWLMYCKWGL